MSASWGLTFPSSLRLFQIWVSSNPRGAERLPPGIIAAESDFYPRRLWGKPSEVCMSTVTYECSDGSWIFKNCLFPLHIWIWFMVSSNGFDQVSILQDLTFKPKYLVTFTVGLDQKKNIDACVKKVLLSAPAPLTTPIPLFFFSLLVKLNISLTVFRELYYSLISLWWPNNWMGWVWVVKASYSCQCS